MTPQPLPKPSDILRPYLTDPNPRWTYGHWRELLPPAPGTRPEVLCRCQAEILREHALAAGHTTSLLVDTGASFVCRVYAIPTSVFDRAMAANDNLDSGDAVFDSPEAFTVLRRNALAPKYLARAIRVYEEAGL